VAGGPASLRGAGKINQDLEFQMPLDPTKLRVGDILLFYATNGVTVGETAVKALKIMTVLPAVASAVQGGANAFVGSASCNHAAIVSGFRDGAVPTALYSHATGGDPAVSTVQLLAGEGGSCQVFRQDNDHIADQAGEVAQTWAPLAQGSNMRYSAWKAFGSVFRSSSYGPAAKQRQALYRANRATQQGPQDLRDHHVKSMFCSMFVIACYQAVMGDVLTESVMALDAKNTSPMYFDGYLRNNNWWHSVNAMTA
jgi:hypothetical protein